MNERSLRGTVNDARLSWIPGIMLPAQIWCFHIPSFPHPRAGQVWNGDRGSGFTLLLSEESWCKRNFLVALAGFAKAKGTGKCQILAYWVTHSFQEQSSSIYELLLKHIFHVFCAKLCRSHKFLSFTWMLSISLWTERFPFITTSNELS